MNCNSRVLRLDIIFDPIPIAYYRCPPNRVSVCAEKYRISCQCPLKEASFIHINPETLKGTEKDSYGADLGRRFLQKRNKWDDRCREGREQIERVDITDHGRLPFNFIAQSRKAGCRLQRPCTADRGDREGLVEEREMLGKNAVVDTGRVNHHADADEITIALPRFRMR